MFCKNLGDWLLKIQTKNIVITGIINGCVIPIKYQKNVFITKNMINIKQNNFQIKQKYITFMLISSFIGSL